MTCFVMGDSIAVGVSQALPACHARAKSGITSSRYVAAMATNVTADLVVISLGANDWHLPTYENLSALRRSVSAARVLWLLPNIHRPGVRDSILRVAAAHGDRVIDTAPYAGADHIHPTGSGYRAIAARVRDNGLVSQ
jgi:lysophospholipase L1-like esterase